MAYSVNGIGSDLLPARGLIDWEDGSGRQYDAVEAFTILFLPLFPRRAVHVSVDNGVSYSAIPLQLTRSLVMEAWARRASLVGGVLTFVFTFMAFARTEDTGRVSLGFATVAILSAVTAVMARLWVGRREFRHRRIRLVLGPREDGSSDPASWGPDRLDVVPDPRSLYDGPTYAGVAKSLMIAGRFPEAMWCARLAAARENVTEGEALTDMILANDRVFERLQRLEEDPSRWSLEFAATEDMAAPFGA